MPEAGADGSLITLVVVVLVVARFLVRELRARTIEPGFRLWGRPVFLIVLTLFLAYGAHRVGAAPMLVASSAAFSVIFGLVVGFFVVRSTTLTPGSRPGTLIARGSWITVAIWVGALLLRLLVRFVFRSAEPDVSAQMTFNVGALAMVTAAFTYVAFAFARAQTALRA